jgi:hypothetical protein
MLNVKLEIYYILDSAKSIPLALSSSRVIHLTAKVLFTCPEFRPLVLLPPHYGTTLPYPSSFLPLTTHPPPQCTSSCTAPPSTVARIAFRPRNTPVIRPSVFHQSGSGKHLPLTIFALLFTCHYPNRTAGLHYLCHSLLANPSEP